jgi:glycosyltransferase involved in cell wall biosynthesis
MKIVVYLYSLGGGGAERVSSLLMHHWLQAGHEVTLLTLALSDTDHYPMDPRIQRQTLKMAANSKGLVAAVFNNVRRLYALRDALRRIQPDVTLSMMNTANVHLALVGGGVGGCRIGSERTYPPAATSGRLWSLLRRLSYRRLDAVVAQTAQAADWLHRHAGCTHVPVIPNPVAWPLARHDPHIDVQAHLKAGRNTVLAVGRLAPEKQFNHLVAVFGELASRYAHWDLVILGEGQERGILESQVFALGLRGRVHLPGRAGNPGDWYVAAQLFVMCSAYEGFPNTLVEALAAGLPAISYDCDTGPRDVIRDGVDGLLVPANDQAGLKAAISRLMADSAERNSMAEKAVQVRERFALRCISKQWDELLQSLLDRRA